MIIYDVGANIGSFTNVAIKKHPESKIIMVEANPRLAANLKKKYSANKNITVLDFLVSSTNDAYVDFYISNTHTISTASLDWVDNSRFSKTCKWDNGVKIRSITLDKMIEKYGMPDILKVDVEGYELEVFKGLTQKCNKICFEWAEEQYDNINKICNHLFTIGYRDFGFIEKDTFLKEPEVYSDWNSSAFHKDIDPQRKERWGMIWVK